MAIMMFPFAVRMQILSCFMRMQFYFLLDITMDDIQKPYMYIGKMHLHHVIADIFSGDGDLILHIKRVSSWTGCTDKHLFVITFTRYGTH